MKVLLVHNRYRQRGGEDAVFEAEEALLRARGLDVHTYVVDNAQLDKRSKARVAVDTIWALESYQDLGRELRALQPDVVHFHNTFPILSPSAYDACRAHGVPVVQTLHNYRLICPNALCFRGESVCLECIDKLIPAPAVKHRCYRGSRLETLGVATMLVIHRLLRTWERKVDAYIALTEFGRNLLIRGGLPAERIHVKPNFLPVDPGEGKHGGGYFLYVGRLSPEKGVNVLLEAWRQLGSQAPPLYIAGTGPLAQEIEAAAAELQNVRLLGQRSRGEIYSLMKDAACLVIPSVWFEGFPMTLVEGFATGTPVLASRLGSLASIITNGQNGLLFDPGDARHLAEHVLWLQSHKGEALELGRRGRAEYERLYSPDANYRKLLEVYHKVLEGRKK